MQKQKSNIIELTYLINGKDIELLNPKFAQRNKGKYYFINDYFKTEEYIISKSLGNDITVQLTFSSEISDYSYMFANCPLVSLKAIFWDTSKVFDMGAKFENCSILESIDIKFNLNTHNVKYMNSMFKNCKKIKNLPNISSWETKSLIYINSMFEGCSNLTNMPDISKWETSFISNCSQMFRSCINLNTIPDLSRWNMSNIESFDGMFFDCISVVSLPNINFSESKVLEPIQIFEGCISLSYLPENFYKSYDENIILYNIDKCLNLNLSNI